MILKLDEINMNDTMSSNHSHLIQSQHKKKIFKNVVYRNVYLVYTAKLEKKRTDK